MVTKLVVEFLRAQIARIEKDIEKFTAEFECALSCGDMVAANKYMKLVYEWNSMKKLLSEGVAS